MKKRLIPAIERLEARETPDVSLGAAAACPEAPAADASSVGFDGDRVLQPLPAAAEAAQVASTSVDLDALLTASDDPLKGVLSSHAVKSLFANAEEVDKLLGDSAQLLVPAEPPQPSPVSTEPEGWEFLCNYTRTA